MVYYDGIYRLRGPAARKKLGPNVAAAWRVRIIDYSLSFSGVRHLRPYSLVAMPDEEGIYKSTCAESLGRRICLDFKLDVAQVSWIERMPKISDKLFVAVFKPYIRYDQPQYKIGWRDIQANELSAIKAFIPEAEHLIASVPVSVSETTDSPP
jgi:hypothetical protein